MKHRIGALTTTRAIAALMVVIFHYGCTVFPFNLQEHFFRQGNLAVGYFFVLSGFVMYLSYTNKEISYGDFLKRRIARIWPLYFFAILLGAAYPVYKHITNTEPLGAQFGTSLGLNISLLQAYIPGYALTINSPGWSLSVEMFFYMLFPLLLYVCKKQPKTFVVLTIVAYVITQVSHLWVVNSLNLQFGTRLHEFVYYQPIFHLSQFMVGICGAMYLQTNQVKFAGLMAIIYTLLIILAVNYVPHGVSLHNGLLSPLFLLLILSVASLQKTILSWAPLVFLGEISYGIYILQEPLHFYFMKWNMISGYLSEKVFFYCYLLLLITFAGICYYLIELPLRRLITGRKAK